MSLRHGILGLLSYQPQSGWDLDRLFRESLAFFWPAQTSQIYRELGAMEKAGWLESDLLAQDKRPKKRLYRLTPAGWEEFLRWLRAFEPTVETAERSALLMRLFFGGCLPAEENRAMLRDYRSACAAELDGLGAADSSSAAHAADDPAAAANARYWRLTIDHGRRVLTAKLAWIDHCLESLKDL